MRINSAALTLNSLNQLGYAGYGKDFMEENGSVTFGGADTGDVYYNGAAVADMPLQTTAAAVELVSDSVQDDMLLGGTGAWTVMVAGLDENYNVATETFIMDGAVEVVGTQLFIRVLGIIVLTAGTNETNVGNIDIQAVGGGQVWDRVIAGEGRNQHSLITVPANKTFHIVHWAFTSNALVAQTFNIMVRSYGGAWIVQERRFTYFGGSVGEVVPVQIAGPILPKTDIKMRVTVGGAASISSHMAGFLCDV